MTRVTETPVQPQAQQQPRVQSKDGKLYEGMTINDAYKDESLLSVFTSADKNGDKVLDACEIQRYNGPRVMSDGIEYYPGLTLEEVNGENRIKTFRDIDNAPSDGVIQEDEITAYKYDKEKEAYDKQKQEYVANHAGVTLGSIFRGMRDFSIAGVGIFGGMIGGVSVGDKIDDAFKIFRLGTKARLGIAIGVGVLAAGAFALLTRRFGKADYYVTKEEAAKEFDEKYAKEHPNSMLKVN